MPVSFWAVVGLLAWGAVVSFSRIKDGTGIPMLAVLGTVTAWYVGDAFYNDYAHYHVKTFTAEVLSDAWWEVGWFLVVFMISVPLIHQSVNARDLRRTSGALQIFKSGVNQSNFQRQLTLLFNGCFILWGIIGAFAALRLQGEVFHYFFPFIGYKAEPWGRGRLGGGIDALLTLAFYLQLMTASVFGVAAALLTNPRLRGAALVLCLLSWPYFLLDRTRNTMLEAVIPGVLCWALLRVRGGVFKKGALLGACFIVVNAWMAFVIANRSDMTMMQALHDKGFNFKDTGKTHQEGLNMYEELCWENTFLESGSYRPNWGSRYFAELCNPIPRVLWPGKPLIGIDYAIARGQGGGGGGDAAGVNATVSTGVIGQGVVNFGTILGPAAAALLMAFWVAALAKLDLHIDELGRLPLFACGLLLTFNLGRDITFITLYPFVFGRLLIWWFERNKPKPADSTNAGRPRPSNPAGVRPGTWARLKPQANLTARTPGSMRPK
jgi:hypothetical protein